MENTVLRWLILIASGSGQKGKRRRRKKSLEKGKTSRNKSQGTAVATRWRPINSYTLQKKGGKGRRCTYHRKNPVTAAKFLQGTQIATR
jgi:hypothetical protein